jgi:hypothetical protein
MRAYTQVVLSGPRRVPVMVKKGKKMVQLVYTTKSGDVKKQWRDNPVKPHQVGIIKHAAVQNHDVMLGKTIKTKKND